MVDMSGQVAEEPDGEMGCDVDMGQVHIGDRVGNIGDQHVFGSSPYHAQPLAVLDAVEEGEEEVGDGDVADTGEKMKKGGQPS